MLRELPSGLVLGAILGLIGAIRITVWQALGLFDYGPHWMLVALTIATALVGIVTFGSLVPFIAKRIDLSGSRDGLCAVRGDAGRRDGDRHLLHGRMRDPERNAAVTDRPSLREKWL